MLLFSMGTKQTHTSKNNTFQTPKVRSQFRLRSLDINKYNNHTYFIYFTLSFAREICNTKQPDKSKHNEFQM